jgi:zinc protease
MRLVPLKILHSFRCAFIAVLAVSAPAAASPAAKIAPDVSSFTLDNGLEVVVVPDHRAPVVTHMIWYKAGSAEDPPGRSGIAHFLEHLMFKGTEAHPAGEFSRRVAEIGGNENAFTTHDNTVYHQTVARDQLALVMAFEADRMANLVIDDAAIATEREVILEERRSRTDNEPSGRLYEAVTAALFQNSHYGIPIIGWAHEMATLDRADAQMFYDQYYSPNNAVLVVAGDVTTDEVHRLAKETYGKVGRRDETPPRIRPREPLPFAARRISLADPQVTVPTIRRIYLVPSYSGAGPDEAAALDVLAEILGGGSTSRLYRGLVVDEAVAASAGAGYGGAALGADTSFGIYAVPRGTTSLGTLEERIDAVIDELVETGVTPDQLERAKRRIIADTIYAQDSHSRLARVFGTTLTSGGTIADVQEWPGKIEGVTADQVLSTARKYLDTRRSVTGYLINGPEEGRI